MEGGCGWTVEEVVNGVQQGLRWRGARGKRIGRRAGEGVVV